MRPPRSIRRSLLAASCATAVAVSLAAPAPAQPVAYPDPPRATEAVPVESLPTEAGGQNEDANWLPILGNFELWCTMGNPGYSGCANHHTYPAIDIGMPVGTGVYASGPGAVTFAGSAGDDRGTYIEIRHPDGIRSRYFHLSATLVHAGRQVHRGTRIGRSGQSGHATSPHLHYEERTAGGAAKDPGVMFARHGGQLVTYPNIRGHTSWWTTPYGTRLRNNGFAVDDTGLYWGGPGVATGDLNGDGFDDIASGTPGEDTAGAIDSGALNVVYGSADGVATVGSEQVIPGRTGVPGRPEGNAVLGASVAIGDFDGDGFDDVATGAPAKSIGPLRAAGQVLVLYGSVDGLLPPADSDESPHAQRLWSDAPGAAGVSERGDQFGASVSAGDFDGDGADDLVVGAPGEGLAGAPVTGAVTVFGGSLETGLLTAGSREIRADSRNVAGEPEAGDRLGVSLAAGDTDGDGTDDLAVGIPGEDTVDPHGAAALDGGAILVLRGGQAAGLRNATSIELHGDIPHVDGDSEPRDQLGTTLAMGDVNGDGMADVVSGLIGEDVGGGRSRRVDAGALLVLLGSPTGIGPAGSTQISSDSADVAGTAQSGDRLGSGVALGDVNGDEVDDIVAGIAGQDVGAARAAGAVLVLLHGASGLGGGGGRELHSATASTGLADVAETDDILGAAVAVGRLDADAFADIVLGAPDEDLPAAPDAGAIVVTYGSAGGVDTGRSAFFHGDTPGSAGDAEAGDRWSGLFPPYLR